ncbi:replication initiator [Nocardia sp. NPDC049220]|uniref:replication initiator n=1 Tax=Nocardia sp. NPDC049220 TaxID=3155273 RepID=UPI0033EB5A67
MDTTPTTVSSAPEVPPRQTAADRRAMPSFLEVAEATAEKFDICKRPIPMRVYDPKTVTESYIAAPCKSTIASTCPSCAKKARQMRITQCYDGWHLEAEPVQAKNDPTEQQTELLTARAVMFDDYQAAKADGDQELMAGIREVVESLDRELRDSGLRGGKFPPLEPKPAKRRTRSTRRRQDVPDLPRRKVGRKTVGREYAGKYRPSMMITLTLPSYGTVHSDGAVNSKGEPCGDGSPRKPDSYDYSSAARDIIHFTSLFDRFKQNLRRAVGWNVQYYAVVEPQRRGAPHVHMLIRGTIPREVVKQVAAATYFQVWWPHHDHEIYRGDRMPVWDHQACRFVDPDTRQPLPTFDEAQDILSTVDDLEPAHVVKFGTQIDPKDIRGVLGNTEEAARTVGYVTKYLTKSIAEVLEPQTARAAVHYDRLHTELQHTPCSETCAVWLRYGISPKGASEKTIAGRCRGKAHRRDTLGLPGRRVLPSEQWSGKTLPDYRAERAEFVRQLLARVGMVKADTSHLKITPVEPGDHAVPPREHLIMAAISQRTKWRAEYTNALLAADPPGPQETSAIPQAA